MSNTTITPTVGAATLAGVAATLGLAVAPVGAAATIAGVAPTLTDANVAPAGFPSSWSGLGAGAVGGAVGPLPWQQIRVQVAGTFGSGAALVVQGSADGVNWTNLAAVGGANSPGSALPTAFANSPYGGVTVSPLAGGVVLSAREDRRFPFLRPAVVGGDGSTSLNLTGGVSTTGCV